MRTSHPWARARGILSRDIHVQGKSRRKDGKSGCVAEHYRRQCVQSFCYLSWRLELPLTGAATLQ